MVFEDFGVRARRKNECVPHGIIWQGWWPWQVRNRCCRSSKHVKKLLAKALLTEMLKKCWVSYESARARGMKFWQFFFEKPLGFWCFYVKIVTNTKVLEGFRLARANVHFVSFFARDDGPGTRATVVAEVRSVRKSCSQEPFWQKCWKSIGFPKKSARARGVNFWNFFLKKPLGFWCFYVKIVTKTKVLEGFRLARAHVHFVSFFARDSWSLAM